MRALEELLVREIIGEQSFNKFQEGKLSDNELSQYIPQILKLSNNYLNNKNNRSTPFDRLSAESYALYYLPINFIKIKELICNSGINSQPKITSVLDFGCGPGTGTLALLSDQISPSEITLLDRSREMLILAERLIERFGRKNPGTILKTSNQNCLGQGSKYDLIIASNVLNELPAPKDEETLYSLVEALNPNGYLILIEPALQESTRRVMHLRNLILKRFETLSPLFPCTHKNECQMLTDSERDWCHGEIKWEEPLLVKQIDHLTGFNKHRIKYSGFVFQNKKISTTGYRIVSIPTKTKRGVELLACSRDYYGQIIVGKSDKSDEAKKLKRSRLYSHCQINDRLLNLSKN